MIASGVDGLETYSLAFERPVNGDDDTVGLLVYALFKRALREAAQRGERVAGVGHDPSPTVITTYRKFAATIIAETVERSLNDNLAELQQSAALDAISAATTEIKAHIDGRTYFRTALVTSIVAWVVTLGITILIIWLVGAPEPARLVADKAKAVSHIAPAVSP